MILKAWLDQENKALNVSTRDQMLGLSNTRTGGHTARSMMYLEMQTLVRSMPGSVQQLDFAKAIVDENILEKPTHGSRVKSLRHLNELYGLDPSKPLFRALWSLAHSDLESLAQLCLVCTYVRDPQLRQSFELIRVLQVGAVLERVSMEEHLENAFPSRFSLAMRKSMAQNVNTTWTFGGFLEGRAKKVRTAPQARPASAAYSMFAGYLTGLRGEQLLDSAFASLVASNRQELLTALRLAASKGILSQKSAAGIVEFDFSNLLTVTELRLLNESH